MVDLLNLPDVNYWYMQISEYVQLQPLDKPAYVMKESGVVTTFPDIT